MRRPVAPVPAGDPEASPGPSLSERLERETAAAREEAARACFVQALVSAGWGSGVYARFLRAQHYVTYLSQLRALYGALESLLDEAGTAPHLRRLAGLEVRRHAAIEADLRHFIGDEPPTAPGTVTTLHLSRMRELQASAPHLLVAHVYARWRTDVLEGPFLARRIEEAFGLDEGRGSALFRAVPVSQLGVARGLLASRLDGCVVAPAAVDEIIHEARLCFRLHAALGNELVRSVRGVGAARVVHD